MLWKRIAVRETESALVHRIWIWRRAIDVEGREMLETVWTADHAAALVPSEPDLVDRHFLRVSPGNSVCRCSLPTAC